MNFLVPSITDFIDVIIVSYLFYKIITFVKGTRTYHILWGLVLLIILYYLSELTSLRLLSSVIGTVKAFWVVSFIILFQPELRSALAKFGQNRYIGFLFSEKKELQLTELTEAIREMSAQHIGAIIVIEKGTQLDISSGEIVNADISAKLLQTIFNNKTLLHDGAVIIRDDKIVSAKVTLPLTKQLSYIQKYGTRHQAAIGITEETDAIAIVVSEETGQISYAQNGYLFENVTIDYLERKIKDEIKRE
ncbi:MAG: TIGR00159 family protein [Candidatus Cloacimonadota bacterium]|nr:MAG: TIGR00159 family protein [Candidatus Cloacimonadota bacterium]